MFEQADRLDALRTLTMPVLVVVGEQDTPFLGRIASAWPRRFPGARLEIIPDAGHSPQFEAPEAWWKVVSDFFDPGVD